MLISLLPAPVHASERYGDDENAELFSVEAAQIAGAVSTRRAEYATVRGCARIALAGLGYLPSPILRSAQGNPVWPGGVVGSMTHCRGYRAAVVTDESSLRSIGIDAEVHEPLPTGVIDKISREEERVALSGMADCVYWDRVLFSAKESTYKAWYPLTGKWLGFVDVTVDIRIDGTFTSRLRVPGPIVGGKRTNRMEGRWLIKHGLVLTSIIVGPLGEI